MEGGGAGGGLRAPAGARPAPSSVKRVITRAYVFLQTEPRMARNVRDRVLRVRGVESAEGVTGPYDVVAVTEARDWEELHEGVIGSIRAIEGILRALPCVVNTQRWTIDEGGR